MKKNMSNETESNGDLEADENNKMHSRTLTSIENALIKRYKRLNEHTLRLIFLYIPNLLFIHNVYIS